MGVSKLGCLAHNLSDAEQINNQFLWLLTFLLMTCALMLPEHPVTHCKCKWRQTEDVWGKWLCHSSAASASPVLPTIDQQNHWKNNSHIVYQVGSACVFTSGCRVCAHAVLFQCQSQHGWARDNSLISIWMQSLEHVDNVELYRIFLSFLTTPDSAVSDPCKLIKHWTLCCSGLCRWHHSQLRPSLPDPGRLAGFKCHDIINSSYWSATFWSFMCWAYTACLCLDGPEFSGDSVWCGGLLWLSLSFSLSYWKRQNPQIKYN